MRALDLPRESTDGERYLRAEAELTRLFRHVWIVAALLVLGLGGWGAMASIHGAVVAEGSVVVEGSRRVVQHLDGGEIAAIHVKDGDLVEKGALLVSLDAAEIDRGIASLDKEIASQSSQITLIESELNGLLALQAKQLVARSHVSGMQREAARLAGEVARLSDEKDKLAARRARTEIRAPVAGRVLNLVTHTIGGLIAPNSTIAEIVPSGEALVVEARLAPGDIDQVKPGQPAEVRMTGLNLRTTPMLEGSVQKVSADLLQSEKSDKSFYLVRIALAEGSAKHLGGKSLLPGMPAEVLIETDPRSALSYLTKPLADQIMRAFREE